MIGKKFSQLRLVVLTVSLLLIQLVAFSQNIVSVSFTNGAIGTKGNNAQDLQNLSKFQTLQLSKAYFIQNSSVTTFQVQGNDITGTLRLVTNTSNYVDIPGKMVWSANGNPNTYMGFLPSPTLTSFNLSTYGGASYVIDNTKNFALVLNNRTVTFTDGSNIGGNASSPLGDLNAYLATFNNAKPVGPVTVTSQTTSSTNPTITGTATLGSGESLSIEFNGVIYTTGITYPTATTWSWTVPNTVSLAAGTYNVVATITNADGYTLSDVTNNELVISSANFASLGCITIVASGSQAEGTTWTFSNNTISPNSSSPVFLNPSDVLAKMALGDLTISSPCITISENVIGGSHTNALFLNSNKITQAAGVSVTTQGGNITYSAINSPQTSSLDRAITIGATTGTRSVVNANGGNILMNASFASTGTVGGNDGDFAFSLGISDIITSSTGSINLTGDATNSVNAASSTYHAWGLELGDTRIQTASGAITLTGIGGKLTPNSRGIVVWVNRIPRILSASGQITLIDQKPSGFTSPYVYNGLFLYPSASTDLFIGADGTNIVSSSSNVIIRADKMDLYNNAGKLVKFNTSGTVIFESVGTSFEAAPTLDGLSLGSTVSGFTLGKTTNTSNLTLSAATTIAGPVIVHGGVINGNANITSSTASAISLFGKSGLRFSNAGITLQTQGGDLNLSSDYDANSVGNIISEGALTLTSNGGAIRLGGGPNASGFAYGTGVGSRDESPGIWVKGAVTINSGNGDISVKGYATAGIPANASKLPTWGIGLGFGGTNYTAPFSQAAVSLNSGTGKIFMEGWARNPTGGSEGSSLGIIFNNWEGITTQPLTITSANTTADAIVLIGNTESTLAGQRTKNSLRFWSSTTNITATGAGGGITLSGKTFSGNDHPQIVWSGGNILATSGPITINSEKQALNLEGDLYLGSKSGVTGNTSSTSIIRLSVDNYSVASGKQIRIASTGQATIEPFDASFKNHLSVVQPFSTATGWSFNENGQTMSALTIGKTGNASALTIGSATTVAGPVTLFGGALAINGALTATSNTINLNATGAVTQTAALTASNLVLGGSGTFTLNNVNNNVTTIAAGDNTTRVGNISLTDASGGLTIGTVGNTTGIQSTGTVLVETLVGDLTLSGNITTTNTTASAITLNAGKSTAIGTTTGGNILVTGTPTVTTGTGGIAKLFSGSDAGSTGLTTLVGGASNTRDGVDETTTSFSPVLTANTNYALYRNAFQIVTPNITSFTPTTAGNGETVVITGTGFTGVSTVKFGNVNATSFVVNSNTQITAVVGNGGSGDVLVQNTAGSDNESGFIFKVVELKFEGNTLDQTAADRDGTVVGTATYSPGASGQAICFTNTNTANASTVSNYLKIPDNILSRSTFTISLRFKTSASGAILGYQNQPVGTTPSNYVPILYVRADGKLSANLWQGSILNVTSTNRVDDGNWHKVEFSVTPGSISIYIDNQSVGTSSGTIQHLDMSYNQLGASFNRQWPGVTADWLGFTGCMDEFFIVDQALTASQIQQVTALPQPTFTSFAPTTAKSGETVTITGTNLGSASSVKLGGVVARRFNVVSATEVRAIVPNNATINSTIEVTTAAGTISGTTFTYDCNSNALDFDADNDHVVIGDVIEDVGAFTQEAWVYWKGSSQPFSEIFSKEKVSTLAITNANKLHANFGDGSSWGGGVNSTTSLPLNTWTHVAVSRSTSGVVKLYINGVLDASTATLNLTGSNTNSRVIGGKLVGSNLLGSFSGAIDEVKAWNTERTAQQIVASMGTELIGNESGLIAYYNFNQGAAAATNTTNTTLNNLTAATNLNGTLTNMNLAGATSNFVSGVWPVITSQPASSTNICTSATGALSVTAYGPQLTYQWYSNTSASNTGGTVITGANSASLSIPTISSGTYYYYVVVTAACSQTVTSTVSTVDVNATNWTKIYETTNPSRDASGEMVYTAGFGKTGGAASSYNGNFSRIKYRLENNVAGTLRWAEVSFDAWTNVTLADLQIPDLVNNLIVQRNVSNIEVSSNMPGVHTGNFSTGRLEFWNQNYFTSNSGLTPAGDPTNYDWDDLVAITTNGHGSFQIHNVSPQKEQTIFGWNMHRNVGSPEIGIGNAPTGNPDWTFNTSNGSVNFKVQISVQDAPVITPNGIVSTCVGTPVTLTSSAGASYLWSNGATTQSINTANAGNYTVTVTQVNGCNATSSPKTVTVTTPPTAATITGTQEVCVGGTTQFNAGQNVSGTWTTSNGSIATVNSSGVITGVAAGNATITFTIAGSGGCANVVSTRTVAVTAAPIAGTLSGNNAICINSSTTFISTQTGGTWSTSAANIASVNPASGLVTGVAAGTSIITYTVAGGGGCAAVTATRTITVNSLPIITYPNSAYSFERTKAITAIQPTSTGVTIATYAISPSLPTGLSFSTTDGSISGTPSVVSTSATYTVSGTTAAGCSVTRTFTLQVFNAVVPSALSYAPASQTVRQGTAIATMSPNASGDAVASYSISAALPQGLTFNTSTGVISGILTAQQTGTVVYTITATNTGGSTTATVTLIYNTAPTDVALSSTSVAENAASGTTVASLSATDADAGDTFTYTLVSGTGATDNASFTISGSTLRTAAVFDFETKSSYSVRVRVTDAGGLTFEKVFTIGVTDVNEAPTNITVSASSVAENAASGTTVASLSATDIDAGEVFTYTLVSGTGDTDNASFTITGNTVSTAAVFDFETKSSYSVRVRVTDAGGLSFEKEFIITVANINDAPTNISASASSVAENAASGTTVASLSATDADAGDTFKYTLVSGTGDTDNASFTITGNTVSTAAIFDFETKSSYSVRVRVTDAGGLTFEKVFTINVTDVNEAPTALALSNTSVLENAASGTAVGTLAGTDADAGDTHTYTLVTGTGSTDNASFTITGTTLNTAAVFNFEAKNSYTVRVRVTDAGGLSFERAFTITVTDVNEAPTLNAITDRRVYNVTTSQVVNLAGITAGPETAQSTTTSVSTDRPATFSSINVVGTQIQFTLAAGIVTPQDVVVTVRVRDNGGVANGGVDTIVRTFRLGIDPMPIAAASPNLITLGATAQLSAAGANAINYTWVAVGGSGIVGSGANINVRPAGTTTYAVVVTNSFGYQATVPLLLTVIVDYKLVPNNLVTPNGDGVNDRWVIPNIDMYPDNEVMVYDKAGRAVFAKRGYNNEWDGTVNGKKLKEDAYFYVIKFNKDGALPIRGYVSIVR